jgi:hypothetical protein
MAGGRADIDDIAPAAHERPGNNRFRDADHPGDICLHDACQRARFAIVEALAAAAIMASIIDQDCNVTPSYRAAVRWPQGR